MVAMKTFDIPLNFLTILVSRQCVPMMPDCQQGLHSPTQLSLAAPAPPPPSQLSLISLSALSSCSGHRYVPLPLCTTHLISHLARFQKTLSALWDYAAILYYPNSTASCFSFKQWGGGWVCQDGMVHPTSSHQSWLSHKGSDQILYTGPLLPPPVPTCQASSLHNPFSSKATLSPKRDYL